MSRTVKALLVVLSVHACLAAWRYRQLRLELNGVQEVLDGQYRRLVAHAYDRVASGDPAYGGDCPHGLLCASKGRETCHDKFCPLEKPFKPYEEKQTA